MCSRGEGFNIDTGPTVLTLPQVLADTFAAAGRDMASYLTIDSVDPMYRATFADGSVLRIRHEREAMTEEIRNFANAREAGAFNEFCEWLGELYTAEMPNFVDTNYDSPWDLLKRWRGALDVARHGGFGRLDSKVASFFEDDRLRRIFSYQTLLGGLAPNDALAVVRHLDVPRHRRGRVRPAGRHAHGARRARPCGRRRRRHRPVRHPVTRILRGGDNAVTGVELGGSERLAADAVVCNADLPVAYNTLLGGVEAPRVARRGRYSPSCSCGWPASAAARPRARPASTSTSATSGTRPSRRSSSAGCA